MGLIRKFVRQIVLGQGNVGASEVRSQTVPDIPAGSLIYAIGDIHGRVDCLKRLLAAIRTDAEQVDLKDVTIIFLGDYVDRADDSRDVIECCIRLDAEWPGTVLFLRGNHEEALMEFLTDPIAGKAWLSFGGLSTLMSYGVTDIATHSPDAKVLDARDQFDAKLPDSHRRFYQSTIEHHIVGNIFFCHAGIDPRVPPDAQTQRALYWGEGTGEPPADWPHVVVHGHHVVDHPENTGQRVNVDTGAYYSGKLTAARIGQGRIAFLQS